MVLSDLIKQIKEGNMINGDEKHNVINDILNSYSFSDDLHYLWSKIKKNKTVLIIKIKADDNFYRLFANYVNKKNKYYFLIDKICLEKDTEHQLIYTTGKEIMEILIENYWDLDEVYFFDYKKDWLIAINHNFEIYCVGDEIIKLLSQINEIPQVNQYIIKYINIKC